METFKLKSMYVNSKYVKLLYPIMFLGVVIFVGNNPSIEFLEPQYVTLAGIALVLWTIYDVYKISKLKKYFVSLNEENININDEKVLRWDDINSVTYYNFGVGMMPIIKLNDDKNSEIPATIENLDLLKNKIEKHIPEKCKVTTA